MLPQTGEASEVRGDVPGRRAAERDPRHAARPGQDGRGAERAAQVLFHLRGQIHLVVAGAGE